MEQLRKETEAYIREHRMLIEGDLVCVGLSGGADSVCLLLVMDALRRAADEGRAELPRFSLCAAHVHHGLRAEADAEEAKDFCTD